MKIKLLLITICSALAAQAATLTTDMYRIDYDESAWNDASKQVLERTLSYWESVLDYRPATDSGKIYMNIGWAALGGATIGSASTSLTLYVDTPTTMTAYTNAQRRYLLGDFESTAYDGEITFSTNYNFSFTEECPNTLVDFQTVLLHEIAHVMGINSLYTAAGAGTQEGGYTVYTLWDKLLGYSGPYSTGSTITIGDPELGLTVYNPSTWAEGSSMAHITSETDPNAVMNYSVGVGEVKRAFSEKELALYAQLEMVSSAIPEPCTTTLGLWGLAALLYRRRRQCA